jgi:phosphate transport system substrate-binding protein
MKRWIVLIACIATLFAVVPAGAATGVDDLIQGSRFCDSAPQYRPGAIVVDGPASQLSVHREVLQPAFADACIYGSGLVTYLGTGEQSGINAVIERRADRAFGTADIPMTPVELAQADADQRASDRRNRIARVHQIPLFISIQSVVYNISFCSVPRLNLRSSVLSSIYTGVITKWNDPLLVADNPSLERCNYPIRIVKRADYAGSTLTFKDYLSKRNPVWTYYKQSAQNQTWPTVANACPALDDDGVADCISTTQNSIGYIGYHTARTRHLRSAFLDNVASQALPTPEQRFLGPSPDGCTAAAQSAVIPPAVRRQRIKVPGVAEYATPGFSPTQADWSTVSLTDAPQGYPMCSFAYAFIYSALQAAYYYQYYSPNAARTAADYMWTALTDAAQAKLTAYDYARLPANVLDVAKAGLETIRFEN